jgi:hypothetical protein
VQLPCHGRPRSGCASSTGAGSQRARGSAALQAGFEPSEFAYLLARAAAAPRGRRAASVLRDRIDQRINGRGLLAAVAASIATRVQLLPEVIDVSIVPTAAGTLGLLFATYAPPAVSTTTDSAGLRCSATSSVVASRCSHCCWRS